MIRYKANNNLVHPNTGKPCNVVIADNVIIYDAFNYGSTSNRCSLAVTIHKALEVLSELNGSTPVFASTKNCLDVFPRKGK